MRIISSAGLGEKIIAYAGQTDCENIALAKQGKSNASADEALVELMFIYEFLPFWNTNQIRQKECYLNEKYGI